MSQFNNPYHYWWKVRKYWKMPKIHLAHIGKIVWWYGLPCSREYYAKYFDCYISGLGWKEKYEEPCFEWDPYLCLTFFRKFQIIFVWNYCPHFMKKEQRDNAIDISEHTWESILEMSEFGKSIYDIKNPVISRFKQGKWVYEKLLITKNFK